MKRKSTMLTIAVADGVRPFLVQVAAKEDKEGLWNLSSILFPQIGVSFKVDPGATGTNIKGDTLEALADAQREFLERTGAQRETWRNRKKEWLEKHGIKPETPEDSSGIPVNPKESTPTKIRPNPDNAERDAAFVSFWEAWPRKVARKAAEKAFASAWKKGTISPDALPAILDAVARNAASEQWSEGDGKFIPHPATWINGERWNDSAGTPAPAQAPTVYLNPEDDQ